MNEALRKDMESKGIDVALTLSILEQINSRNNQNDKKNEEVDGVPKVDGKSIIPAGKNIFCDAKLEDAKKVLSSFGIELPSSSKVEGENVHFDKEALNEIGEQLLPFTAWGVLNGGSATSYADVKKNNSLGKEVFEAIQKGFELLSPMCNGIPKGITPAYINPDGSSGESFLVLKMRASLLEAKKYKDKYGKSKRQVLPFFQMTSNGTDLKLKDAYKEYKNHPWLKDLISETGTDPTCPLTAKQPLLAAFSHSSMGFPKTIFDKAHGKENSALALPGGHGQSFMVLTNVYTKLLNDGYRYAYIGNVDNMGYYPDASEIAAFALSQRGAAFEFSYRTPVDVKGGILVNRKDGTKTVVDIGQAIPFSKVEEFEANGEKVLFNCATGLFDLKYIVPLLSKIASELPLRVSDQDKDSGKYSQAEQTTWEVVGLLDNPLGFAVEKSERFIAAKLLAETILASGVTDNSKIPQKMQETANMMNKGLQNVLTNICELKLVDGKWTTK